MKSKRIYLSFVFIISLVLLVLALFIMSKANYEHKKIIIIPNSSSVSAKNNEIVPAPNKNIAYEEEKNI